MSCLGIDLCRWGQSPKASRGLTLESVLGALCNRSAFRSCAVKSALSSPQAPCGLAVELRIPLLSLVPPVWAIDCWASRSAARSVPVIRLNSRSLRTSVPRNS